MTIRIFNPDHDMALASGQAGFVSPAVGRQMWQSLGWLPALWSREGDVVVVAEEKRARVEARRWGVSEEVKMVTWDALPALVSTSRKDEMDVDPWGWDAAICHRLQVAHVPAAVLPSPSVLADIRRMSHRAWAATHLLPSLTALSGTVGQAIEARSMGEVEQWLRERGSAVVKSPWSCSGRGVRYIAETEHDSGRILSPSLAGWLRNILRQQGSIMLEPYYKKVLDFGMEFWAGGDIVYHGLSLFATAHGAYTGSVVAPEAFKEQELSRYISSDLLSAVRTEAMRVLRSAFSSSYIGPFGIDMMIVDHQGTLLLHPCVELNLRRTMGHVALSLIPHATTQPALMTMRGGKLALEVSDTNSFILPSL